MSTSSAFPIDRIRADFPILDRPLSDGRKLIYLDSAATAHKPKSVITAMVEALEQYNSNVHRGIHELGDRMTTALEEAREKVRAFVNAESVDDVIFTSGTTMSINLVAIGYARKHLQAGDEILVNLMEHHANLVPWQMAAKVTGATLRYLPLTADGRLDLTKLDACLTRQTKLVAVTGMSNMLGTANPIAELAQRAHAVGALIAVDGAQSLPHEHVDVRKLGIDFLSFSGHKLYGPTGIGALIARRELQEAMDPVFGGGHMIREVFLDHATWADPPAKFEAGTCAFIDAVGLGAAIDYVNALGLDAIQQYEHSLTEYAYAKLTEIPGLKLFGPAAKHRGAIFSFEVDGVHPHDLSDLLDRQGVAIRAGHHCTMPLHDHLQIVASARASLAIYNTREEVDVLVSAIEKCRQIFRRK